MKGATAKEEESISMDAEIDNHFMYFVPGGLTKDSDNRLGRMDMKGIYIAWQCRKGSQR
jgi:hypothetical protein